MSRRNSTCPETYLVPVQRRLVDLLHRARGKVVNKPDGNTHIDFSDEHTPATVRSHFPDLFQKVDN